MERRNLSLANQYKVAPKVADKLTYNAFLSSYWLGKEEVANKKLLSLIELEKHIGVTEMREFKNTSERSQREMRLLLGQLIKEKLIQRVKDAKWFSVLVDEVTDCATLELWRSISTKNQSCNATSNFTHRHRSLSCQHSYSRKSTSNLTTQCR